MPRVELAAEAVETVDALIESHELPGDTWHRVLDSLAVLERFPRAGRALTGSWQGFRVLIGPWGWMLLIYAYSESDDRVVVSTVQDARRGSSAASLDR